MIVLVLIACHMLGDFVLQTRWQASRKLVQASYRLRHVSAYSAVFVPVAVLSVRAGHLPWWHAALFLAGLFVLHYLTDWHRFPSNLGDRLAYTGYWYLHWREIVPASPNFTTEQKASGERPPNPPLPKNPWEPLPILIDQTLHFCQLALLGWLLVR